MDLDAELRSWLAERIGPVTGVRELVGGLSSQMLLVRTTGPSVVPHDLVVRRWPGVNSWEADRVRTEVAALTALADTSLATPQLICADPDGTESGRPTTVMTFLDGTPNLAPTDPRDWVRQLAAMLVRIHRTPPPALPHCRLWSRDDHTWLGDDQLVAEASALADRPPRHDDLVLSHADYHHFNLLWIDQRLTGVVDWTGTGLATRGFDVGHCRLNLAVLFSADLAMQFLDDYEQLSGVRVDPAPDLQRLLCFDQEWPRFIPLQVAGRRTVDGPGMADRVRETVVRTLRRAG